MDGVADRPCEVLNNKTPLEYAKTKNLDYLTSNGKTGYVQTIKDKVAPESDTAVLAMLGYDPYKYYTGRGPLEAIGAGMDIRNGDLCLRINFGTLMDKKLVDRRAGRTLTTKEATELTSTINKHVNIGQHFIFKNTIQHRGVLVIRGELSDNITNVDPAYIIRNHIGEAVWNARPLLKECKPLDVSQKTKFSAKLVNEFVRQSYNVLKNHPINQKRTKNRLLPANVIITRDAGVKIPELPKKENWAAVAGMPLEMGIAKLAGMELLKVNYPEFKSNDVYKHLYKCLDEEIKASIEYIKEAKYQNYYIHFKETDITGHDNRPKDKAKMIEIIDNKFFKFIREIDPTLVVTTDHSTPCQLKVHSADPVPLLVYNQGADDTQRFTEEESKRGEIGKLFGRNVLSTLNL